MGNILSYVAAPLALASSGLISSCVYNIAISALDKMDTLMYCRVVFNLLNNPRCKRAFMEEIKSLGLHLKSQNLMIKDGFGHPEIKIPNGVYKVDEVEITGKTDKKTDKNVDTKTGTVYISIENNQIMIKSCRVPLFKQVDIESLIKYVCSIYTKHNASSKVMIFFTSQGDKWGIPICRIPRDFTHFPLTPEMRKTVSDVEQFMQNKARYISSGRPFKRGYLLHGPPGTGKSTCIEVIANKYNMSVYMLTLNDNDMTDSTLVNLLCRVPSNSIIAIEEIDKQMATLKKNKTTNVSLGGLFTAIDGPQRLSDSTIVIMTANHNRFLSKGDMFALCRSGRIDCSLHFTTKLDDVI